VHSTIFLSTQHHSYRSLCNTESFGQSNEYKLYPHLQFEEGQTNAVNSASGHTYPALQVSLFVERHLGYWLWNVALPLYILSSCSFLSFAINRADFAGRVGVCMTVMLTVIAFKYSTADKLPRISYLTWVDKYLLSTLVLQFVILIYQFVESPDAGESLLSIYACVFTYECVSAYLGI
jgi:hypothetical protein